MAKKKAGPPKDESKTERFKRVGERRLNMALKYIGLCGNLIDGTYESTAAQRDAVLSALQGAVSDVEKRFKGEAKAAGWVSL